MLRRFLERRSTGGSATNGTSSTGGSSGQQQQLSSSTNDNANNNNANSGVVVDQDGFLGGGGSSSFAAAAARDSINSTNSHQTTDTTNTSTSTSTNWSVNEKTLSVVAHTLRVEELYKFDSAIETSSNLAQQQQQQQNQSSVEDDVANTVISDCSVLVSADGDVLIVPQSGGGSGSGAGGRHDSEPEQSQQQQELSEKETKEEDDSKTKQKQSSFWWQQPGNELGDEYASAVFYGNDLQKHGDKKLNGFSMKGYSLPAATLCVKQTADTLGQFEQFLEELILTKKNCAVQEDQTIDQLRSIVMVAETALSAAANATDTPRMVDYQNYLRHVFPPDQLPSTLSSSKTPLRVGPLSFPDTSIHGALVALEQYYSAVAESESTQFRKMTQKHGAISRLRHAREMTAERVQNRHTALQEMIKRVKAVEDHLKSCKDDAKIQWEKVHETEMKVTQLVEAKMLERSRVREQQRLKQMQEDDKRSSSEKDVTADGASTSDIWDLVSAATASMEEGSFEPMDLPQLSLSTNPPVSASSMSLDETSERDRSNKSVASDPELTTGGGRASLSSSTTSPSPDHIPEPLPLASRYEIEEECGLPDIRTAAVAADDAVEDAANSLLSVLHNLDTTKRSARLAAESCVVASCNAQAECLRSIVDIERANLMERLQRLDELEAVVNDMNVRSDIDRYVSMDKKESGGQSLLGDDDDGGVASALAVLNNHADGDISGGRTSLSSTATDKDDDDGCHVDDNHEDSDLFLSPEDVEEHVAMLFKKNPELSDASSSKTSRDVEKATKKLDTSVNKLCKIGEDQSPTSRTSRASICYALNARQRSYQRIPSSVQFDGLCKVMASLLSGYDCNDSAGISKAKLLMDLSLVFYLKKKKDDAPKASNDEKIYVKSRLIDHPIWSKDQFWDEALLQSVGESLSQSGVMSNFERSSSRTVSTSSKQRSEYTDAKTLQWHDLTEKERYEAASQVHAVVFSQLGTMVDSMLEYGIGLERRVAFVRRMSVRNQLPISQRTTLLSHLQSHLVPHKLDT